jgi:hypothetical protein
VCLSNRKAKTTDKPTSEEEHRTDNRRSYVKQKVERLRISTNLKANKLYNALAEEEILT